MSLKSINPTETKSWSKLQDHFNDIKETHINDYFISNTNRSNQLSISFENFHFDFSYWQCKYIMNYFFQFKHY